jgi:hypothetical protein
VSLFDDHDPRLQARNTDPETSAKAARRLRPGSAKSQLLALYYWNDLTDEEAANASGLTLYAVTKRCADLRRDGLIEAVGLRAGESGNDRMVCRITDAGRGAVFMFHSKDRTAENRAERRRRDIHDD